MLSGRVVAAMGVWFHVTVVVAVSALGWMPITAPSVIGTVFVTLILAEPDAADNVPPTDPAAPGALPFTARAMAEPAPEFVQRDGFLGGTREAHAQS